MTPCSRGCCWSPYGCARSRECECHWADWLTTAAQAANNGAVTAYRDPTSQEAIYNIEKARGQR
jgi:hypothetical protein